MAIYFWCVLNFVVQDIINHYLRQILRKKRKKMMLFQQLKHWCSKNGVILIKIHSCVYITVLLLYFEFVCSTKNGNVTWTVRLYTCLTFGRNTYTGCSSMCRCGVRAMSESCCDAMTTRHRTFPPVQPIAPSTINYKLNFKVNLK